RQRPSPTSGNFDMRSSAFFVTWILALAAVAPGSRTSAQQPTPRWITAWGSSQHAVGMTAISNATVRLIARVTVPRDAVRLRFHNASGKAPLVIGSASVGVRMQGAAIVTGSNQRVLFNQTNRVTIPPGGSVVSDPVRLKVLAGEDLAVSLYVPENDVRPSQHT